MQKEFENFREFLDVRRDVCGLATWKAVADKARIGTATVDRVIADNPYSVGSRLENRDAIAGALGFIRWWELVNAWLAWTKGDMEALMRPPKGIDHYVAPVLARILLMGEGDRRAVLRDIEPESLLQLSALFSKFVKPKPKPPTYAETAAKGTSALADLKKKIADAKKPKPPGKNEGQGGA